MATMKALCCVLLCLFSSSSSVTCAQADGISAEQWRKDIGFLVEQITAIHPNPYAKIGKEEFDFEVSHFLKRLPGMEDHKIRVGVMRLMALLSDGHSNVWPSKESDGFTTWFPVRMRRFADGIFITAVSTRYAHLASAEVKRIGRVSAEEAFALASTVVSGDNDYHRTFQAPFYLAMPNVLHALEIIESREQLKMHVITREGKEETARIEAIDAPFSGDWFFMNFFEVPSGDALPANNMETLPLHFSRGASELFWFEYLPEEKLLYFQLNIIRDAPDETFAEFCERMWSFVDSQEISTFIIDLRHNGGGNMTLLLPLIHGIIKRDEINQKGTLYTIIGNQTFSAAINCVSFLEIHTNTEFVGEPTGASMHEYAEVRGFNLPNSNLWVNISRFYWQNGLPWDRRQWRSPDVPAPMTSKDFFSNQDPALRAIRERK